MWPSNVRRLDSSILSIWVREHCSSNIDFNWTSSDQSGAGPLQLVRPNDVNRQYRKDQNLNIVIVDLLIWIDNTSSLYLIGYTYESHSRTNETSPSPLKNSYLPLIIYLIFEETFLHLIVQTQFSCTGRKG